MAISFKIKSYFNPFQTISIAPLVIFRIIFGGMLVFGSLRFIAKGWIYDLYIQPQYYFGYLGFEWVKPFPGNWMYLPFAILLISSFGIMLGAFYRLSAFLLFLSFTYIELLDKSNYLNHYYFICLIAFLLMFVPANGAFSLDVYFKRIKEITLIPVWNIGIFKFQLAVVYIFAGIAKLEYDWLVLAQPLKIWLQSHRDMPVFGDLLAKESTAYLFSWMGCLYDLTIVFFLLYRKTRPFAYFVVVIFHLITWFLLPIGIFPWVMIVSTLLFFSVPFHEKLVLLLKRLFQIPVLPEPETRKENQFNSSKKVIVFIGLYAVFQICIPFRHILYPGNIYWNEEGYRFSWRVMLMHKEGFATFYIRDAKTKQEIEIRNSDYLCATQIDQMVTQPDMILQFARILKNKFDDSLLVFGDKQFQLKDPSIHAEIFVSMNGRPSQLFVSKKHDLSKIPYNLTHRNWLESYKK